mgnify:CR=1 FL=1
MACRVKAAEWQAPGKKGRAWWECQTCKQAFTGAMQRGIAEAHWTKVQGREQEDGEWQMAALLMARALGDQGRYGEAETMQREVPISALGGLRHSRARAFAGRPAGTLLHIVMGIRNTQIAQIFDR